MKKTFKDYITVLFGTGFARGIAFLNSIIIARLLGPEEFGKFSIFYVVMILTWLFPGAFDTTFVRYAKTSNSKAEKKDFLKTAVFLKLVYSVLILCSSYPLAYFLANYCFHKPEIQSLLIASMICGVFLSFLKTVASTFQEKERFVEFAGLHAFYTISILCILILLKALRFGFSLKSIIFIYLTISTIIGIVSIRSLFQKIGRLFPLNINALKTSFSLGKWIFGIACIYYIFQRIDTLFLARYVKFGSIGIYSVAGQLIMLVSVMTGSLSGVFLPKASRALDSRRAFKVYVKESILGISMINTFVAVLAITAPFCIKILYGNEYILAGSILRILLVGWFISIIYKPFSFLFYTLNDSKTKFLLELLKFFAVIMLLYYLVPLKGIIGAAIAISVALSLNSIISLIILKSKVSYRNLKTNERQ